MYAWVSVYVCHEQRVNSLHLFVMRFWFAIEKIFNLICKYDFGKLGGLLIIIYDSDWW